ncbi:MAG: NAD(P)H-binding protein [Pseudomonadota bacterium]
MTAFSDPKTLLFGATGTAGQGVARALAEAGYDVAAPVRGGASSSGLPTPVTTTEADISDVATLDTVFADTRPRAVISCIASRSGRAADAWAVDHDLNLMLLRAAQAAGARHFILLSAICVQRPELPFQRAKLAFEAQLIASGLTYSIVRPTAFFKSLAGQIRRVQAGKPYLMFGDGRMTACKPISDRDLGRFIARCLTDADKQNAVLPIGGPGPALTPRDMGEMIFRLTDRDPRFRRVPPRMMDAIVGALGLAGRLSPRAAAKAELARIGRYYATEAMLLWNAETGRYDADATPEFGTDRIEDYVRDVVSGRVTVDLGEHAVF